MANPVVYSTRNRQSGTTIDLRDRDHPDNYKYGSASGRWITVCREHEQWNSYAKQNDAFKAMTNPVWCPPCKELMARGEKVPASKATFQEFKEARAGSSTEQSTGAPSPQPDPESDAPLAPEETSEAEVEGSEPEDGSSNLLQSTTLEEVGYSELRKNDVCFQCGGKLKAAVLLPIGHFHSTKLPARDICCSCAGHTADAEA